MPPPHATRAIDDTTDASDVLDAARRGRSEAMVDLLMRSYPDVLRISTGLIGDARRARHVTLDLLRRGLLQLDRWPEPGAPGRWFRHHTVLVSRRETPPPPRQDALTSTGGTGTDAPSVGYLAFVVALRELPRQQAEAFLLNHAEGLDDRWLGICMDCSRTAADGHLKAADATLRTIGGVAYDAHVDRLRRRWWSFTPDAKAALPTAVAVVRREQRRRFVRWVTILLVVGVLGGISVIAAVLLSRSFGTPDVPSIPGLTF